MVIFLLSVFNFVLLPITILHQRKYSSLNGPTNNISTKAIPKRIRTPPPINSFRRPYISVPGNKTLRRLIEKLDPLKCLFQLLELFSIDLLLIFTTKPPIWRLSCNINKVYITPLQDQEMRQPTTTKRTMLVCLLSY